MNKILHTNCEIIKDLLPLYIDKCCSEESIEAVETHLRECEDCKSVFESMNYTCAQDEQTTYIPKKLNSVKGWQASVLQSVLLFISFGILSVGITLEAYTPYGVTNGIWAFSVIVPTASFMLSLSNWYFVKFYKSRCSFSWFSVLFTALVSVCFLVWATTHFRSTFVELSVSATPFLTIGLTVSGVFCLLSKLFSNIYAKMLGKE